jgi:hypothetical protein
MISTIDLVDESSVTNAIHNLETVGLRYSVRRAKILSLLRVASGAAALDELQEKFWRKQDNGWVM